MAEPDDVTTDVRDFALDTLAEWIQGYTTPVSGPQQKCTLTDIADDGRSIDVRMETMDPFPSDARDFRIWLEVEEL